MANFAYVLAECIGHPMLMCCRGITAALWHDSPLIKSPWCLHSSEVDVAWVHPCLEEGICHVHFSKNLFLPTVGEYIINAGQGETVPYSVGVESTVVIHPAGRDGQVRNSHCVFGDAECR